MTLFTLAGLRVIEDREYHGGVNPPDPGQLNEEIDPDVRAIYTFGAYLDEALSMHRWTLAHPDIQDYYVHRDHNYNTVALTAVVPGVFGSSTEVIERVEYDPYGAPTTYDASFANAKDHSRVGNPHLFTGQRQDPATGLYYYKARYYAPGLGRFVSADPFEYIEGPSLYQYCASSPMHRLDPLGFASVDPSDDVSKPSNDKSRGCDIQRRTRDPFTRDWLDPGHSWIEVPDPGRHPADTQHPEHRQPGTKRTGHYPDGYRTPHGFGNKPSKKQETSVPAPSDTVRKTKIGPDRAVPYQVYPGPPIEIKRPLRWGPGKGKLPSQASCEEIRRCIFECEPGTYRLTQNNCHDASRNCLKWCGLELLAPD